MRVPEGAVQEGVVFKLESVSAAEIPPDKRPDLPGATLGAALRLTSEDKPAFKKEVDLVFPKPADAPAGAFYYVYRQLTGPDGRVIHQTIDKAMVEGDKVVTASAPFSGYVDSIGGWTVSSMGQVSVHPAVANTAVVMWTHDPSNPGAASSSVFSGRILRGGWDPQTNAYVYTPVAGAPVWKVNGDESPAEPFDLSHADGTYTFFDPSFTGGLATVRAIDPLTGQTLDATAYAVPKPDWAYPFRAVATANITFTAPGSGDPAPEVVIRVLEQVGDEWREDTDRIVSLNTPIVLALNVTNGTLEQVTVEGQAVTHRLANGEYLGSTHVADHVPVAAGAYSVTATLRASSGFPMTRTSTFLAVAPGGTSDVPQPGPPQVLRTVPPPDGLNVAADVMPQVFFTEPVTNVIGGDTVKLVQADTGQAVPFTVMGVGPDGPIAEVRPESVVTSLTLRPASGLRYGKQYKLSLSSSIVDRDTGEADDPKELKPYDGLFKTFLPQESGQSTDIFPSPGIAVLGDRAYLVENYFLRGETRTYDISDPATPRRLEATAHVSGRPVDIAGQLESDISDGPLIAVGTTATNVSLPSTVHLFDAVDDQMKHVGIATLTRTAVEGTLVRFALQGRYLYALTQRRGVQVVDMARARDNFRKAVAEQDGYARVLWDLKFDGRGFGHDAVVRTIPVTMAGQPDQHYLLADVEVGDYLVQNAVQPLAMVTGEAGLVVVNPFAALTQPALAPPLQIRSTDGALKLHWGRALALGRIGGRDLAVVVGNGTREGNPTAVLGVVDLSPPLDLTQALPSRIVAVIALSDGDISLTGQPTDVILRDDVAIVAGTTNAVMVNLANPAAPYVAGHLDRVAGRLASGADNHIYSTAQGALGAPDPLGGLHSATDGICDLLELYTTEVLADLIRDPANQNTVCGRPAELTFRLCRAGRVTLLVNGQPLQGSIGNEVLQPIKDLQLAAGVHTIVLPEGTLTAGELDWRNFLLLARDGDGVEDQATGRLMNRIVNRSVLPVGRTFVKGVDLFDGHVVRQGADVKVNGRFLGLEVTRSYSSAGRDGEGVMGAGWSWNYDSRIVEGSCGLWTVITADGSSQTFRSADGGATFLPQRGYHTELRKQGDDLVFIDKAHNEHLFHDQTGRGEWRLVHLREPHGDRLQPRYDDRGRVIEVGEYPAEDPTRARRSLRVHYATSPYGFDRIRSIVSDPLDLRVAYGYDGVGNLTAVRREFGLDTTTELYTYAVSNPEDPHQLTAVVDANGARTEYAYHSSTEPFPGEPPAVFGRQEYAKEVREFPREGVTVATQFTYDVSEKNALPPKWKATVTDGRLKQTLHVLNGDGSPLRIEEPGVPAKVTQMGWRGGDILKDWEEDAEGRRTEYDYDAKGNLTLERVVTADLGPVETRYTYDLTFNKLTQKIDAREGRTVWHLNATTGDLEWEEDAVGNKTTYAYTSSSPRLLESITSPRHHITVHSDWDSFGNPRTIRPPLGPARQRTYDSAWGWLLHETDGHHDTRHAYDGFGRETLRIRRAGGESDDEVTKTAYYPGGQVLEVRRAVRSSKEQVTTYELDGMNRVVKTSVNVAPEPVEVSVEYDPNGNKEFETDARGVRRRFVYDALNRLKEVRIESGPSASGPVGLVATYEYDRVGNKVYETDIAGLKTCFEYDGLYRVKKKWLADLPGQQCGQQTYFERYEHDNVGNRTLVADANGHESHFTYDRLNRVASTENALGQITTIAYDDPEGSHVNKSQEDDQTRGLRTSFVYDALNRETERVVHLEGEDGSPEPGPAYTTRTAYDDEAHTVRTTTGISAADPVGTTVLTSLDHLDRPMLQVVDPEGLGLATRTVYDGLGNRKLVVDPEDHSTEFSYDELGRLVEMRDADGQKAFYGYDGGGLKTRETDRRQVQRDFTYDNLGRLTRTGIVPHLTNVPWSQVTEYLDSERKRIETDANGNRTTLELDGQGRVVRATDPNDDFTRTVWDGVNKREETDKKGRTTKLDSIRSIVCGSSPTLSPSRPRPSRPRTRTRRIAR